MVLPLVARAAQALVRLAKSPAVRRAAVKAAQKARATFKRVSRKVVQNCKQWGRNRKVRQQYNARKRELKKQIDNMRSQGKSREEIARKAHEFRRKERVLGREQMKKNGDGKLVKKLRKRDANKYGNKNGPDFKQSQQRAREKLRKKLRREPTQDEVFDQITESATKTDVWTNIKFLSW